MTENLPACLWVVPHTHWDREWYEPHDVFRARLVEMLDSLLDLLEREPAYRFTLDGQSAAIEDYLEIRPEQAARVRGAVARGQLALGPFQILLDEFCCDGETIVRNLERGISVARALGGELRAGYLPDMFGHAAQMPQMLRGFGIRDAVLWRGVPARVRHHAFLWRSPDGSSVRVEYLWDSYGNALKLLDPPRGLTERVAAYLEENREWFAGEDVAGWYGTDHSSPNPELVRTLRASQSRVRLRIATVGELIAARDHCPEALARLPQVTGELRSHSRGNLLPGVLSVRAHLKEAMARAEQRLTIAERMDACVGGRSRTAYFERGWGLTIESTAHDSVTGCGVDATAAQVESRLRVAAQTADGAIHVMAAQLAGTARAGEVALFNPSGFARPVQAELVVECDRAKLPSGVQPVESLPTVLGDETIAAADLGVLLRRIHGQELFGGQIRSWSWPENQLTFVVADSADGDFDLAEFTATLRAKQVAGLPQRVLTMAPPAQRVLLAGAAEGLSVVALGPDADPPEHPVSGQGATLTNGLVEVSVGPNGGVSLVDVRAGHRIDEALTLVDDGDRGDSYNCAPLPDPVSSPECVEVTVKERGPLRGRILLRRTYLLPEAVAAGRRAEHTVPQVVDTLLEVRADEPFVRVRVSLTNQVRDHRLRVLVPTLSRGVTGSASAGQYGLTRRGRAAEGGWGEFPLPTFPATRYLCSGGLGVLLDRLVEYEVIDPDPEGPSQVALTVLRAVGLMSVNTHPLRDEPAGSQLPVPGAQGLGRRTELCFAVDFDLDQLPQHSDVFRLPPVAARGVGGQARWTRAPQTHGDVVLESLRRTAGGVEARFVNYCDAPRPLRVRAEGRWVATDLAGNSIGGPIDVWRHEVPAAGIFTIRQERPCTAP